ncbi:MAG: hypothetical protein IT168_21835 [Bryobacterales bacterium]|nr:hypothetical protein [Bryobacterales bacterium]
MRQSLENRNVTRNRRNRDAPVGYDFKAKSADNVPEDRALTRSGQASGIIEQFRASLQTPLSKEPLTRQEEDDILGFGPEGV